jgi:phenylpropionate dioxygenase-like ring-hydroxylating dioxygenase large terminal subunit
MTGAFNNPGVHVQSWYVAARSEEVRRGRALSRELLGRRVALYRGEDGGVRALDARCAHLGADLGDGTVVGNRLRCAFHHWTYGEDGRCRVIPYMSDVPETARTFAYPAREKHGCIWIFAGTSPSFEIPSFERYADDVLVATRLRPRILGCHPHLAIMNGLDIQHFRTVHGFDFIDEPSVVTLDAHRVQAHLKVRLRADTIVARGVRLVAGDTFTASFTTWGGNMATIEGSAGSVPVLVFFTHRPLPDGRSASQTFLFAPRARGLRRLLGAETALLAVARVVMGFILSRDRDVLDGVLFRPNLVPADAPLATFIRQVNAMPILTPE